MKTLKQHIEEGLLSGMEDTLNTGKDIAKNVLYDEACRKIEQFIMDNYRLGYDRSFKIGKITIKRKPNKDGKYIVDCKTANEVSLRSCATALTNDIFVWGKVRNFQVNDNVNITSLEGCPEEVEDFSVISNSNLKTLDGMPKVTHYFNFGFNNIKVSEKELQKLSGAPNITVWDR